MADGGCPGRDGAARDGGTASGADGISQVVVSMAADGIVAVDEDGRVVFCNPAAEELFARPADRLTGTDFGFPLVTGETTIELMLPGGGTRAVEMRVTAALLDDGTLHVAALRDVTRWQEAESRLEEELAHKNVIVAVAAHQLHNPLATIAVLVDLLRSQGTALPAETRAATLDRIAERTAHLQALVRKLLTAARVDAALLGAAPEDVPVLPFLLERLGSIVERADEVRLVCPADLVARVDRAAFSEMLANYLDNAFAYGRPPVVVRAAAGLGSWLRLSVCDHGDGVPDAFVPHLFERFSRAPEAARLGEGTGLGLWIVRSMARANGGDAWYEPAPRGGACFRLRLPRVMTG